MRLLKPFPDLLRYKVAQYIFVNVPAISLHEWHPFSIASAPYSDEIEIFVKSLGNWTQKLYRLAEREAYISVRLDGPYGNLNLDYQRYSKLLLVGGGIGVTPIIGLLQSIYSSERKTPMKYVLAVFTLKNITELNWFAETIQDIRTKAARNTRSPYLDLQVHVTRPEASEENMPVLPGTSFQRPNLDQIFEKLSKHQFRTRSNSSSSSSSTVSLSSSSSSAPPLENPPTFVFVCGPKKIVNVCWDLSKKHTASGKAFHFHHETFEF